MWFFSVIFNFFWVDLENQKRSWRGRCEVRGRTDLTPSWSFRKSFGIKGFRRFRFKEEKKTASHHGRLGTQSFFRARLRLLACDVGICNYAALVRSAAGQQPSSLLPPHRFTQRLIQTFVQIQYFLGHFKTLFRSLLYKVAELQSCHTCSQVPVITGPSQVEYHRVRAGIVNDSGDMHLRRRTQPTACGVLGCMHVCAYYLCICTSGR